MRPPFWPHRPLTLRAPQLNCLHRNLPLTFWEQTLQRPPGPATIRRSGAERNALYSADIEQKAQPSKWVTLRALRVVKQAGRQRDSLTAC